MSRIREEFSSLTLKFKERSNKKEERRRRKMENAIWDCEKYG
jgi:hypothetical protein